MNLLNLKIRCGCKIKLNLKAFQALNGAFFVGGGEKMPYIAETQEEILAELQTQSQTAESKVEGTFSYDCFSTNAIEFQKFSLELAECYKESFGDTATGEYLEMRAAEHGIIRRTATKSKGTVTVSGKGTVREGSLFATQANVRFTATETVEVDGTAKVSVEAQVAGNAGNVAAGTINRIPLSIAGIYSVINAEETQGGYDAESDDDFRERYLLKVRRPSTTGNPADYIHYCLTLEGVGAVTVLRNPFGLCTVGLWIVDSNLEPADEELLQRVSEAVATFRPIGAQVYVNSAQPVTIDITADIIGTLDIETFKTTVIKYFQSLLLNYEPDYTTVDVYEDAINAPASYITRAKIGEALLKSGASDYDYDSIRLNGNFSDITLTAVQMPLLGTVTVRQTIRG